VDPYRVTVRLAILYPNPHVRRLTVTELQEAPIQSGLVVKEINISVRRVRVVPECPVVKERRTLVRDAEMPLIAVILGRITSSGLRSRGVCRCRCAGRGTSTSVLIGCRGRRGPQTAFFLQWLSGICSPFDMESGRCQVGCSSLVVAGYLRNMV
jgi:hypothetical protein